MTESSAEIPLAKFEHLKQLDFGLYGRINSIAIRGFLLAVCDAKGIIVVYNVESEAILLKIAAPDEVLCLEWLDSPSTSSAMSLIFGTKAGQVGYVSHGEVSEPACKLPHRVWTNIVRVPI